MESLDTTEYMLSMKPVDSMGSICFLDSMTCVRDFFDFVDPFVSMDPWIPKSPCIMVFVYDIHGSHSFMISMGASLRVPYGGGLSKDTLIILHH